MALVYLILSIGAAFLLLEIASHMKFKITLLYTIILLWKVLKKEKNKREQVFIRKTIRLTKQVYKQTTFFPK